MQALIALWQWLLEPAFTVWGAASSRLELLAVVLALAMVGFNIRELHWGWPLAIVSSLLYFGLFARSKLYGDAALQIFFAGMALWGWWCWLRGHRPDGSTLRVARLSTRGSWAASSGKNLSLCLFSARSSSDTRAGFTPGLSFTQPALPSGGRNRSCAK